MLKKQKAAPNPPQEELRARQLLLPMGGISMGGFKLTQALAPPGSCSWHTLTLARGSA